MYAHLTAVMWSSNDCMSLLTRLITQPLKWFNLYLFSNLYLEAENEWGMNNLLLKASSTVSQNLFNNLLKIIQNYTTIKMHEITT